VSRDLASGPFLPAWAGIARGIWSMFRVRWRTLLIAGVVLFVPIGLLETIDHSLLEAIEDADDVSVLDSIGIVAVGALETVGTLLGEVVFAGVVTASVLVERRGGGTSVREMLAELSPVRLAVADLLYVLVVLAGAIALIVPGLLFLVWFALLAPVIEVEHATIREAFGRSRALVRRRPWLVAAFVLPIVALDETLTTLAHDVSIDALGEGFGGEWGAAAGAELLTSLPLALAVVVLYFELADSERRASLASYSSSGDPPIRS